VTAQIQSSKDLNVPIDARLHGWRGSQAFVLANWAEQVHLYNEMARRRIYGQPVDLVPEHVRLWYTSLKFLRIQQCSQGSGVSKPHNLLLNMLHDSLGSSL
jgi:hypothetical protein